MKNNVSIKDIAKMAGVSIATVSRVINKSGKVAKETEENILQIMKENNYVPNLLAKGIRTNKVTTVGIVIPDISNEFFSKIAKQIQTLFFAKGYASIICNTSEDDKIEKQCIEMLQAQQVGGIIHIVSEKPEELFPCDPYKAAALKCAAELMNDCMDNIYEIMHQVYPKTFRPQLYISSSKEINAVAIGRCEIVVYAGLIFKVIELIDQKYTDDILNEYDILKPISKDEVRAGIRVYTWRFIVLHELFHIWHAHSVWRSKYHFNENGKVENNINENEVIDAQVTILDEIVLQKRLELTEKEKQAYITRQAMELDADSCAISMIINMLMRDARARLEQEIVEDEEKYITAEVGLIMGALATAFSLFDGNAGAKFELLKVNLESMTHPIPAIRMYVAEEVVDGMLWKYYPDQEKHFEIEKEWKHIVCDVEPYYKGKVDMGRVFYYTAYTEKAQRHLEKLRVRLNDMRETLENTALCALAEKMEDEDMKFDPQSVWFTDEGASTHGWINPATGENTAIKLR